MPSNSSNPESLGVFTDGDIRAVVGRTSANIDVEDVYSFSINQPLVLLISHDLASARTTYINFNSGTPGYIEDVSQLGDRLVNTDFTLARDTNNDGIYNSTDQIIVSIPDGQVTSLPIESLLTGTYFLVYEDDQESFFGSDLLSSYGTSIQFFQPVDTNPIPTPDIPPVLPDPPDSDYDPLTGLTLIEARQLAGLYLTWFDRTPDRAGWEFWKDSYLNYGVSFFQIAEGFSASLEARAAYDYLPSKVIENPIAAKSAMINQFYNNMFNRTPDLEGFNFWSGILTSPDFADDLSVYMINAAAPPDMAQIDQNFALI